MQVRLCFPSWCTSRVTFPLCCVCCRYFVVCCFVRCIQENCLLLYVAPHKSRAGQWQQTTVQLHVRARGRCTRQPRVYLTDVMLRSPAFFFLFLLRFWFLRVLCCVRVCCVFCEGGRCGLGDGGSPCGLRVVSSGDCASGALFTFERDRTVGRLCCCVLVLCRARLYCGVALGSYFRRCL